VNSHAQIDRPKLDLPATELELKSLSDDGALIITIKGKLDSSNSLMCFTFTHPISYKLRRQKSKSAGYFRAESDPSLINKALEMFRKMISDQSDRFVFNCREHRIEVVSERAPEVQVLARAIKRV